MSSRPSPAPTVLNATPSFFDQINQQIIVVKKNQHLLRGTQSDETQIFLCSFQLNWLPGIVVSFPHPVFHTQHNVSFVQVVHTCIHVFYFKK